MKENLGDKRAFFNECLKYSWIEVHKYAKKIQRETYLTSLFDKLMEEQIL